MEMFDIGADKFARAEAGVVGQRDQCLVAQLEVIGTSVVDGDDLVGLEPRRDVRVVNSGFLSSWYLLVNSLPSQTAEPYFDSGCGCHCRITSSSERVTHVL
jgi:hypothetical protein